MVGTIKRSTRSQHAGRGVVVDRRCVGFVKRRCRRIPTSETCENASLLELAGALAGGFERSPTHVGEQLLLGVECGDKARSAFGFDAYR